MSAEGKTVRCDCGFEVLSESESGLVDAIRSHAALEHGTEFSEEEALLVILRSQLDAVSWTVLSDQSGAEPAPRSPRRER